MGDVRTLGASWALLSYLRTPRPVTILSQITTTMVRTIDPTQAGFEGPRV